MGLHLCMAVCVHFEHSRAAVAVSWTLLMDDHIGDHARHVLLSMFDLWAGGQPA